MTQKSFKKPIKFSDTMVDFGAMSVVLPFYVETNNVPIGEVNFFASYLACQYPRVQPLSGCKCTSQTYLDQNTGSMGKQKWVPQKRRIFVNFSRLHSKLFLYFD